MEVEVMLWGDISAIETINNSTHTARPARLTTGAVAVVTSTTGNCNKVTTVMDPQEDDLYSQPQDISSPNVSPPPLTCPLYCILDMKCEINVTNPSLVFLFPDKDDEM